MFLADKMDKGKAVMAPIKDPPKLIRNVSNMALMTGAEKAYLK